MASHVGLTLLVESEWLLLWSPGTELFKLIELDLGYGNGTCRTLCCYTGGNSIQSLLFDIMILKCLCVQLEKYLKYKDSLMITLGNAFKGRK